MQLLSACRAVLFPFLFVPLNCDQGLWVYSSSAPHPAPSKDFDTWAWGKTCCKNEWEGKMGGASLSFLILVLSSDLVLPDVNVCCLDCIIYHSWGFGMKGLLWFLSWLSNEWQVNSLLYLKSFWLLALIPHSVYKNFCTYYVPDPARHFAARCSA